MNPGGTYAEQFSYDAWGRRRNPTNWTFANVPAPNLIERGYTGHEHLDKFGLINMNGRMYDPVLGRFFSVDPIVQAVGNSQSLNGYSYCVNNPFKYTDPSGYSSRRFEFERNLYANETGTEFFENYPVGWSELQHSYRTFEVIEITIETGEEKEITIETGLILKVVWVTDLKPGNYQNSYQLIIGVYGDKYKEYNWVQTTYHDGTYMPDGRNNFGFKNYRDEIFTYNSYSKHIRGANSYFEDTANARNFFAYLTLVGKTGDEWVTISSFRWGYNGDKIHFFEQTGRVDLKHTEYLNFALFYHNNH